MKMRIGVDPGTGDGAIAFLREDLTAIRVFDMPVMALGGKHQQVNAAELAKIMSLILEGYEVQPSDCTVYIERVHAMPGNGSVAMFNFGMSYGVVIGVCGALKMPVVFVQPNAWKKAAGLIGKPKDASRSLAQQFYPELDLSLKKHVGRADALIIARMGFLC